MTEKLPPVSVNGRDHAWPREPAVMVDRKVTGIENGRRSRNFDALSIGLNHTVRS